MTYTHDAQLLAEVRDKDEEIDRLRILVYALTCAGPDMSGPKSEASHD